MTQSIGPPSLAQGTRIAVGFSTSISRFIPACGELSKPSWAIVQLDGSSPLARGTQDLDRLGYVADRFIPAYAGNSQLRQPPLSAPAVHPRLRGELDILRGKWESPDGSSPLTRGTLNAGRGSRNFYAGSSPLTRGTRLVFTGSIFPIPVHPRLRGELSVSSFRSPSSPGSSPLTRGTHY